MPETHPLSFRGFMNREVYGKIEKELLMPEEQRVFPDPENLGYIPELIEKLGGVDICFGGIGINGHVAFNEADASMSKEEFLAQKTRVLEITKETRTANAIGDFNGALEDMPHYCVTIGIWEIAHAKKSDWDASETGTEQWYAVQLTERQLLISRYPFLPDIRTLI